MGDSEQRFLRQEKIWLPIWWCLPSLLGFASFIFAFPIDRSIPFLPSLNLAEIFASWFLFVTPVTTVIAIFTLVKRKRREQMASSNKAVAWIVIAVSAVVNGFVHLACGAATYKKSRNSCSQSRNKRRTRTCGLLA